MRNCLREAAQAYVSILHSCQLIKVLGIHSGVSYTNMPERAVAGATNNSPAPRTRRSKSHIYTRVYM